MTDTTEQTEQIVEDFVERLGLVAQAEGLPRIAGKIMGFLVIHGGPFSFTDLAERLKVSRSSISTNSRLLEHIGVIERFTRSGDRQDYFRIRREPYMDLLQGSLGRLTKATELVAETQQNLPEDWTDAQARLTDLGGFYTGMAQRIEDMIESYKTERQK